MASISILKKYVTDSNEALEFKLVRDVEDIDDEGKIFKPVMSHQVFGENETIFGYSNLKVKLYYSAASLQTYVNIVYSQKISPTQGEDIEADDILQLLVPVLAPNYLTNIDEFRAAVAEEKNFIPYGAQVHSFVTNKDGIEKKFEIYKCDISDRKFVAFHARLQTFLLWYVDGSSFIDIDDPQWTFFVVFEKYTNDLGNSAYSFAGYSTIYKYYAYPDNTRPRISQMLILPPFQKLGIGAELLETIYNYFVPMQSVIDITVEDPSEDFQRLRDFVDCCRCSKLASFSKENLLKGFNKAMANEAKFIHKVNPKQARRIYEILRLKETNINDPEQYREYRLAVKQRLNWPYKKQQNDVKRLERLQRAMKPVELAAAVQVFGSEERMSKLSADYKALEEIYLRIIQRVENALA